MEKPPTPKQERLPQHMVDDRRFRLRAGMMSSTISANAMAAIRSTTNNNVVFNSPASCSTSPS